jgi:IS5 family transposase
MKAHIGVDADSGLVHTVTTTATNVADVTQTAALLHGKEKVVHGDAGYTGADKRDELASRRLTWHIAAKRGTVKALKPGRYRKAVEHLEYLKAAIRAKVEPLNDLIRSNVGKKR